MIGRPGSTLWLFGHELRLSWRGLTGGPRARARIISLSIVGLLFLGLGAPLAFWLRRLQVPINPLSILAADAVSLVVFTLMLSQTLAGAAEALYARGDLDLLFSSPLAPRKILTVRFASMAANAMAIFALLATPFVLPMALFGHWAWLGVYPTLAALALMASASGLALAVGLFAVIGPRRTRAVAQVLAAIIGALFFLSTQLRTLLGARSETLAVQVINAAADPRLVLPPLADLPLRAMLGQPLPLLAMTAVGIGLFALVCAWLSARFAGDSAAAQGADVGGRAAAPGKAAGAFVGGVFAATFRKELRLLGRDIALISQVLLRVLYLLPASFLLLRNAGAHDTLALPGGAAVIAVLTGQVAGSLTWITVSAEDAPELLAAAPAPALTLRNAKLAAGLAPLVLLLAVPLVALTVLSPITGMAATVGATASAIAAGLLNAWHPNPGKRADFRRRRSGSVLMAWVLLFVSLLIGAAAALLAAPSVWAALPAGLAGLTLLALRRSPKQIAEALAAKG